MSVCEHMYMSHGVCVCVCLCPMAFVCMCEGQRITCGYWIELRSLGLAASGFPVEPPHWPQMAIFFTELQQNLSRIWLTFIEHLLMLATASRLRDEAENTPCPQSIHPSSFSLLSFCLYNRPFTSGSYGPPCILYPVPCMLHPSLHNPASHQTLVLLPLTHNHAL